MYLGRIHSDTTYLYQLRPAHGSGELLIEIFHGADRPSFFKDMMQALEEIQPEVKKLEDSWVRDEFVYHFESTAGTFSLHIDTWGLGFIMVEENSGLILVLDRLLQAAQGFEKTEFTS